MGGHLNLRIIRQTKLVIKSLDFRHHTMVCIKYILIYYNGHEDSKDPSLKLVIKSLDFTLGTIHKES